MIPATQRADGTWRKSRKIRAEGPTRYVPPALKAGRSGSSGESARSLENVTPKAYSAMEYGSTPSLKAALFILVTGGTDDLCWAQKSKVGEKASSPVGSIKKTIECRSKDTTASIRNDERQMKGDIGRDHCLALHSAASAAENYLKCRRSRRLSVGDGAVAGDGSEDDNWWAKLKQVTQDWCNLESVRAQDETWVGLELSLRPSDIRSAEGQQAIVEFFHEVVVCARDTPEERPQSEIRPCKVRVSNVSNSHMGHAEAFVTPSISFTGFNGADEVPCARDVARRCTANGCIKSDSDLQGGESQDDVNMGRVHRTVVGAVLIFSSSLTKQDRAELHGQAQLVEGITSGSHGVSDARFLVLTCGFGELRPKADIELSEEKAALAKHLFWLAQGEYHSRYERMSHGEIREIVASGGPTREEHPDLFHLLEKHNAPYLSDSEGGASKIRAGGVAVSEEETTVRMLKRDRQSSDRRIGGGASGTERKSRPPLGNCPW